MEEKNNNKELTLNDLARMMTKGFEESRENTKKLVDDKIDELATSVQNEFLALNSRVDKIQADTADIRANFNKKVDRFEHNELKYRVEKTEEKLGLKQKMKFA